MQRGSRDYKRGVPGCHVPGHHIPGYRAELRLRVGPVLVYGRDERYASQGGIKAAALMSQ